MLDHGPQVMEVRRATDPSTNNQKRHELKSRLQVEPHSGLLLVIRNGSGELVVKAENKEELQRWTDALGWTIAENGKRRAKIMEDRAARGEVSEEVFFLIHCV